MQIIKTFLVASWFLLPICAKSQSTLLPFGSKEQILLNRMEVMMQRDTVLNHSSIRPFQRQRWVFALDKAMADSSLVLSSVDRYNLSRARLNSMEWLDADEADRFQGKPIFGAFYRDPANMLAVRQKDFFLSVNPVLQLNAISDDASKGFLYLNTRGVVVRSLIGRKIGFHTYLTENQEKPPAFVREQTDRFRGLPGAGLYKRFKEIGYDYFDARGSVFFNAAKYVDLQFGYDRMFIGNGFRSLFWSDHSPAHLFLNMNLRVWRLNYMSRIMELQPQYTRRSLGADTLFSKKYAAVHYLTLNAPKWLTIGFFEGIIFGRLNKFEFHYLNPVIFLRVSELQVGSPDNAFLGFDIKANIAKRLQFYGQVMLDEFDTRYIREKDGWWANKWAFQGGLKYVNAAGIKNLDLQLEANWIRPFTYSHFDTVSNYTHFNQPLAHPLMSDVREFVGILTYQPKPKWYLQAKVIRWKTGEDPVGTNYGNNIFRSSNTRSLDYPVVYGGVRPVQKLNANLWVAYEWKENLFLEGSFMYRKANVRNMVATMGLRWNMQRREYDY